MRFPRVLEGRGGRKKDKDKYIYIYKGKREKERRKKFENEAARFERFVYPGLANPLPLSAETMGRAVITSFHFRERYTRQKQMVGKTMRPGTLVGRCEGNSRALRNFCESGIIKGRNPL